MARRLSLQRTVTFAKRLLPLLVGCFQGAAMAGSPFALEAPHYANLIHVPSDLYVHREVEIRVDARRIATPPPGVAPDIAPVLSTSRYTPISVASTNIDPNKVERRGDHLVWTEVSHLSQYDLKGRTAFSARFRWEPPGAQTESDVMEVFPFPEPDVGQFDQWSPWVEADSRRSGTFAWHAEVHGQSPEALDRPTYPFELRFRLVLSRRMYP